MTYVNYAPEPTSLMVKLVGISLVTLLIILGLVSASTLQMRISRLGGNCIKRRWLMCGP